MTDRTLLAQALAALEDGTFDRAHWITALRSALAAPQPEPVALESVHLTRDTQGMCVVRVNGRVAIRDNGDIIDHMATLEWFATPPAAPAEPCYCDRMGIGVPGVSCGDCPRDYKPAAPAPDVPMTDEQFADMVADASLAVDLAANPLKLLAFARAVLSAAPAAPRPDEFTCPYCFDQGAAPAVPLTDDMVEAEFVSRGDDKGQGLHPYWKDAFREGFNFARSQLSAAPAVPAVCDGGTCGLGGYCANCPRQGAAPAVPVSWDRLRTLMDGIPTREEFIGGQRQKYVAKEEVMGWLYECQLRAEREAVQPAAPTVQVVLRQPNLFASAPAVREPQDERAAFEAWHSEYRGLVPLRRDDSYFDTHARLRWEGWQARAHGIGGGGK